MNYVTREVRMRRILRIILICLAVGVIVVVGVEAWLHLGRVDVVTRPRIGTSITADQKVADFDYLRTTLQENFPYFAVKKRDPGIDWLARSPEFEARLRATPDDVSYFRELSRIVSLIQNGHTQVCTPNWLAYLSPLYHSMTPWGRVIGNSNVSGWYHYWERLLTVHVMPAELPVLFRYVEGAYVAESGFAGGPLPSKVPAGSLLTAVDGVPVHEYVLSLAEVRTLAKDDDRNLLMLPWLFVSADLGQQHTIGLLTPAGVPIKVVLQGMDPTMTQGKHTPNVMTAVLDGGDVAYLGISSFSYGAVNVDHDTIRAFLKENRTAKALIVDIRGNGGGDDEYWMQNIVAPLLHAPMTSIVTIGYPPGAYNTPFIRHKLGVDWFRLQTASQLAGLEGFRLDLYEGVTSFSRLPLTVRPQDPVGFDGRVFLLVDASVCSSTESFAVWAKATGWATLVGTRTGGDGIGFDPVLVALPNSGIVVRFPADMGINPDGSVNEESQTSPDVAVKQTIADERVRLGLLASGASEADVERLLPGDAILRTALELARDSSPGGIVRGNLKLRLRSSG